MKTLVIITLLLCTAVSADADDAVAAPSTYEIGSPIPGKRVAVMNLKVEGQYSDELRDWLPALIEDRLLREGWTLVVRGERMRHIQEERNLPGVKPETKLPEQELLGATAFLELTARVQVKDIQGIVGYKTFTFGDYARASVDLNGQIVDPATGVLKSSVSVDGSAGGLKTALVLKLGTDWRIAAGGYNVKDIRETLVGKAADKAADKLIQKLKKLYPSMSAQRITTALQPSSTTVGVESSEPTILLSLPDSNPTKVGEHYGIFRGDTLIAEVEIMEIIGKRAIAKIVFQIEAIKPTDKARRMIPIVVAE